MKRTAFASATNVLGNYNLFYSLRVFKVMLVLVPIYARTQAHSQIAACGLRGFVLTHSKTGVVKLMYFVVIL